LFGLVRETRPYLFFSVNPNFFYWSIFSQSNFDTISLITLGNTSIADFLLICSLLGRKYSANWIDIPEHTLVPFSLLHTVFWQTSENMNTTPRWVSCSGISLELFVLWLVVWFSPCVLTVSLPFLRLVLAGFGISLSFFCPIS
jgi:hypothetical protein